MKTHEIVNLIVQKFGGNRVPLKFDLVCEAVVDFVLGHNLYRVCWNFTIKRLVIQKYNGETFVTDTYSRWVEGILNNMVRNDAGEMVPRC